MKFIAHTMEYQGETVTSNLHVTNYSKTDYLDYKRVYEDCFHNMRTALRLYPVDNCDNSERLLEKAEQIYILRVNGEFVGSVAIYGNEIDDLFVAKKYQHRGYGKQLLNFALSKMQKRGIDSIILGVADWNQNALHLYRYNGFVITKSETKG